MHFLGWKDLYNYKTDIEFYLICTYSKEVIFLCAKENLMKKKRKTSENMCVEIEFLNLNAMMYFIVFFFLYKYTRIFRYLIIRIRFLWKKKLSDSNTFQIISCVDIKNRSFFYFSSIFLKYKIKIPKMIKKLYRYLYLKITMPKTSKYIYTKYQL